MPERYANGRLTRPPPRRSRDTARRTMTDRVDLYDRSYGRRDDAIAQTRRETFEQDVGQNTWVDVDDLAPRTPGGWV